MFGRTSRPPDILQNHSSLSRLPRPQRHFHRAEHRTHLQRLLQYGGDRIGRQRVVAERIGRVAQRDHRPIEARE